MPSTLKTLTFFIISLLLQPLIGCSERAEQVPGAASAELQKGPEMAKRTVHLTKEKSAIGKQTFVQYCAGCHGEAAEGRVGIAPSLVSDSFLAAAGDEFLIRTLQQGRSNTTMVSWSLQIPRHSAEELVSYLRELNPVEPAELNESPVSGNAGNGENIFATICATCHGATGRGYQEAASGTAIRGGDFLRSVSNGFLRHIIREGKSGTKMKPFTADSKINVTQLSETDIEDMITYLRSNAN